MKAGLTVSIWSATRRRWSATIKNATSPKDSKQHYGGSGMLCAVRDDCSRQVNERTVGFLSHRRNMHWREINSQPRLARIGTGRLAVQPQPYRNGPRVNEQKNERSPNSRSRPTSLATDPEPERPKAPPQRPKWNSAAIPSI